MGYDEWLVRVCNILGVDELPPASSTPMARALLAELHEAGARYQDVAATIKQGMEKR